MLIIVWLPGDLRWLRRYRYTWFSLGLALTALTLLIGVNPEGAGARLWLGGALGVFLQPAELLKIVLVVFLAAYLADRREQLFTHHVSRFPNFPYFLPLLIMWLFSLLILFAQRDLGAATLFFAVFLVMLYLASGQVWYVVAGGVLLVLAGVAGYTLFDVVRVRVDAWWNPWADPSGRSFQIVQSLLALAAGGLFGSGPGLGSAALVPVAHSDFIFAALGEEWGLAGMIAALALLLAFVFRGLHIAMRASGAFNQLLAAGLSALIGLQALLIIGGVIKVIPLTGLTLPFVSYGGSSLLVHFVMVGLLLRLSASSELR
jgi:cell division protein FtsW (lipid II flippase)